MKSVVAFAMLLERLEPFLCRIEVHGDRVEIEAQVGPRNIGVASEIPDSSNRDAIAVAVEVLRDAGRAINAMPERVDRPLQLDVEREALDLEGALHRLLEQLAAAPGCAALDSMAVSAAIDSARASLAAYRSAP